MRTPAGTVLRVVLTVIVGLALAVGCSDDPKPGTVKPPTSAPVSTSASPTPSTPEAQIEATMRAYFAAANDMFRTGDVSALRSFSTSGCPCREITDRVERVYRGGGHYENGSYVLRSIHVHDVKGETGLAEVAAKVPPYKIINGQGSVIENSLGGKVHADFSLVRQGDRWIIGNAFNLG